MTMTKPVSGVALLGVLLSGCISYTGEDFTRQANEYVGEPLKAATEYLPDVQSPDCKPGYINVFGECYLKNRWDFTFHKRTSGVDFAAFGGSGNADGSNDAGAGAGAAAGAASGGGVGGAGAPGAADGSDGTGSADGGAGAGEGEGGDAGEGAGDAGAGEGCAY